jgi:hypothetical protein
VMLASWASISVASARSLVVISDNFMSSNQLMCCTKKKPVCASGKTFLRESSTRGCE